MVVWVGVGVTKQFSLCLRRKLLVVLMRPGIIPSLKCVRGCLRRLKLVVRVGIVVSGVRGRPSYWLGSISLRVAAIATNFMKASQQSLKRWSEQNWKTSDGKPSKGKKRYLPAAAWASLSPAEKAATNRAKAAGNKAGKQFVKQPKKIAKKTARYR